MTPDERTLLEETRELVEENNKILRSIQRAGRFSLALRILYWIVIIGASVGAYYLIEPYINVLKDAYSGLGF